MASDERIMSCVLRISGRDLDVENVLTRSKLDAVAIWRRGEVEPFAIAGKRQARYRDSGFTVEVSRAAMTEWQKQSEDAVKFLRKNRQVLSRARTRYGADSLVLDFAFAFRHDLAAQGVRLPLQLLLLAVELGVEIELSHYAAQG